ncbi:MAG: putative Ig domain-containing protein [Meiothermus sp.]|uniref:putative Ig domain-containing protein n=1 Tax=Meiothermus sp. TaxID=1955249 RepID=UPI00298F1FC5|nr:putative Ig domain-containing protein [Meiothermus sp.]MDW8425198.1 putative Ig domain-containing protein [Meiothermus sp.]
MPRFVAWGVVWPGLLLAASLLLASCGSDNQTNQSRQPLRLTLRFDPGYVDEPYNVTLTADGGIRPYRFSLEGNLPKGLSYSSGRISGTPQEKGTFELTVSVEDANLSSRTQKVTLSIGETPPPRLDQVFPLAEVTDPFPYLFRVRDREARGFHAQIALKDLKAALDSFKADSGVLYVLRYDEEKGVVDIDAAFTGPRKDFEVFRFTATPLPEKKVRPEASFRETRVAFYDKNSKLAGNAQPIERLSTQGRYKYSDLEALARNWGRRLAQAPANNPTPAPAAPAESQAATTPASAPQSPAQPTQPEQAPPPQPEQAQPTQPEQAQPPQPEQAQASQPEPTQPTPPSTQPGPTPAQGQPAPTPPAPKLEGDLNGDGVVDQKDLDLLRSSYAWASVNAGQAPNPRSGIPGSGTSSDSGEGGR